MTILVTGSAGHLGEALMRTLRAANTPAFGLDRAPSPFTTHVGSITDRMFVAEAMTGVRAVIHAATLHKPHLATHTRQDFVDVNVTGTLTLLEAAMAAGVSAFIYTSTTSVFGHALSPAADEPAAWITEDVAPEPRNIYGVTKIAAEALCEFVQRAHGLPAIVLRTSRFFPEPDDDPDRRGRFPLANAQANEMLYRRADIEDVVDAHLRAVERAPEIGFARYIISATTPFEPADLAALRSDAPSVIWNRFPDAAALYAARGWRMFESLDRVYVNARARAELGWRPTHDFRRLLDRLAADADFRSPLAQAVGVKGYHGERFKDGLYPI